MSVSDATGVGTASLDPPDPLTAAWAPTPPGAAQRRPDTTNASDSVSRNA